MRYNKLIIFGILGMALILAMPVTASAQTLARIQGSGTFNIGFVTDEAPLSFKSPDGQPEGYAVELGQKVAEELKGALGMANLAVKFTATNLEEGLAMAADGRIDLLCAAASDTLKRREKVAFSIPVYVTGTAALLRMDARPDLVRVLAGERAYDGPIWRGSINRALANHTYAVHAGTVTEKFVRDRIATLGVIAKIVAVEDHAKGVEMVVNGNADAYFADRVILENYAAQSAASDELMVPDRFFTLEPIALAMARNNDDFRLIVDATLSNLYSTGGIMEIYQRYFGEPSEMTLLLFGFIARD